MSYDFLQRLQEITKAAQTTAGAVVGTGEPLEMLWGSPFSSEQSIVRQLAGLPQNQTFDDLFGLYARNGLVFQAQSFKTLIANQQNDWLLAVVAPILVSDQLTFEVREEDMNIAPMTPIAPMGYGNQITMTSNTYTEHPTMKRIHGRFEMTALNSPNGVGLWPKVLAALAASAVLTMSLDAAIRLRVVGHANNLKSIITGSRADYGARLLEDERHFCVAAEDSNRFFGCLEDCAKTVPAMDTVIVPPGIIKLLKNTDAQVTHAPAIALRPDPQNLAYIKRILYRGPRSGASFSIGNGQKVNVFEMQNFRAPNVESQQVIQPFYDDVTRAMMVGTKPVSLGRVPDPAQRCVDDLDCLLPTMNDRTVSWERVSYIQALENCWLFDPKTGEVSDHYKMVCERANSEVSPQSLPDDEQTRHGDDVPTFGKPEAYQSFANMSYWRDSFFGLGHDHQNDTHQVFMPDFIGTPGRNFIPTYLCEFREKHLPTIHFVACAQTLRNIMIAADATLANGLLTRPPPPPPAVGGILAPPPVPVVPNTAEEFIGNQTFKKLCLNILQLDLTAPGLPPVRNLHDFFFGAMPTALLPPFEKASMDLTKRRSLLEALSGTNDPLTRAILLVLMCMPNKLQTYKTLATYGIQMMRMTYWRISIRQKTCCAVVMARGPDTIVSTLGHPSVRPSADAVVGIAIVTATMINGTVVVDPKRIALLPAVAPRRFVGGLNLKFVKKAQDLAYSNVDTPSLLCLPVGVSEITHNGPVNIFNQDPFSYRNDRGLDPYSKFGSANLALTLFGPGNAETINASYKQSFDEFDFSADVAPAAHISPVFYYHPQNKTFLLKPSPGGLGTAAHWYAPGSAAAWNGLDRFRPEHEFPREIIA